MKKNQTTIILALVLGVLLGFYFWFGRTNTTIDTSQSNFAVKDTAAIRKIILTEYIQDESKQKVTLARKGKNWTVNEDYTVLPKQLETLLRTIYLVQVREPVNNAARKTIFKSMKQNHIRCEIVLENGDKKIYFVGPSSSNGKGTMMLLNGADDPFWVEIAGFEGYLTPRYATKLDAWREKIVFDVTAENLNAVAVKYPGADSSFKLIKQAQGWQLESGEKVDTTKVNLYLKQFGKIYAQDYANTTAPNALDSLAKINPPILLSLELSSGRVVELKLYPRTINNYFGVTPGRKDLMVIQRFIIDKFLVKRSLFKA